MAVSSGTRSLIGEAMGWVAFALILAATITHLDELKAKTAALLGEQPQPDAAAVALTEPAGHRPHANNRVVELAAEPNGHYVTTAEINGRAVDVLVDTGATMVSLTFEDAERAGVRLRDADFTGRVNTANGQARVAVVTLDRVEIGGILVRDVKATVSEPGRLSSTLLGMSFLSRLSRVDMRQGTLVLEE